MNAGPVIHPPLILMNAGPLEHFERWDIHNEGTQPSTTFRSTSTMYVRIHMLSADQLPSSVNLGTAMIVDYSGNTQLWRAPINGYQSNMPICPVSGPCSIFSINPFMIAGMKRASIEPPTIQLT